ncbi:MAG: sulfotransferase family protein [Pirellula sp.]|nr:sulfotransferase family protein [Pirellula sp.]
MPTLRIAMWSGPRNISTAMMRAWENRPDTRVCDEPFYAYYLAQTGAPHPMAAEIIAAGPTDWREVVRRMTEDDAAESNGAGRAIFYQKQMTHHQLPDVGREWLDLVTNCFLIRSPDEVLRSYLKKNYEPTALDLGFPQQAEIYDYVKARTGRTPIVIDARDVLERPRETLGLLCDALGVPMREEMLSWPTGYRPTDGIWAPHWYGEVVNTTGFGKPRNEPANEDTVPSNFFDVLRECDAIYARLRKVRLR